MKFRNWIIILSFMFSGCNNTLLPFRVPSKMPKVPENSIKKDIAKFPSDKFSAYYKFTKQKQKQLSLSVPENGFDSLLVRFWFTYPENLHQYAEMLEIRYGKNQSTVCQYYRMSIFFNPTREYEVINHHRDTIIETPKNGWGKFNQIFDSLKIESLPSITNLKQFQDSAMRADVFDNTSLTVVVEISTSSTYRFIEYNNFEKYKEIDEVNRMYFIIRYLRDNFYMKSIDENWYKE